MGAAGCFEGSEVQREGRRWNVTGCFLEIRLGSFSREINAHEEDGRNLHTIGHPDGRGRMAAVLLMRRSVGGGATFSYPINPSGDRRLEASKSV